MIIALLLCHWISVHDSNAVHKRYLTPVGNVIGEYYLPLKPSYPNNYELKPYVAQCWDGLPETFTKESTAKNFIEACKNPDF